MEWEKASNASEHTQGGRSLQDNAGTLGSVGDKWRQDGEARDGERRMTNGLEREHQQHQQRLDSEKQIGLVQGGAGRWQAGGWKIAQGDATQ